MSFLQMYRHLAAADWAAAAEKAEATADAGRRHGDRDLVALGLVRERADRDLLRAGGRGPDPAGRGDGRGRGRRGLARGVRQRLLHRDRGLPGDRRARPGGRVDLGPAALVRLAARPGGVHRAVLGPPRPGDAAAGRLGGGARGVHPRRRAVPAGQDSRRDRPGRGRARRRAPAAGRVRRRRRWPTSAPASTASTRSPGWPCSGWRAARTTPPRAAVRRLVAEAGEPAGPVPAAPGRRRRAARRRCGRRGARRRRRARPARHGRGLGRPAGPVGVRLGRRRAGRRRRVRRAPLPAQGAPALDARWSAPTRSPRVRAAHRPRPRRPRRRRVRAPRAGRRAVGLPRPRRRARRRGRRRLLEPAAPARPASPRARSRCSAWSPPAAATPRSRPT